MKTWKVICLAALLVAATILSACGASEAQRAQQEAYQKAYQEALNQYQQQMADYQKDVAEYQKEVEQAYRDYAGNLTKWYEQRAKITDQQIKQIK
ncbi:hypothetical protein ACFLUB_02535 [Chloroflexota bacterium]